MSSTVSEVYVFNQNQKFVEKNFFWIFESLAFHRFACNNFCANYIFLLFFNLLKQKINPTKTIFNSWRRFRILGHPKFSKRLGEKIRFQVPEFVALNANYFFFVFFLKSFFIYLFIFLCLFIYEILVPTYRQVKPASSFFFLFNFFLSHFIRLYVSVFFSLRNIKHRRFFFFVIIFTNFLLVRYESVFVFFFLQKAVFIFFQQVSNENLLLNTLFPITLSRWITFSIIRVFILF